MKIVFAHDHIFYNYNNQFYSTGGLSKEVLERYTTVFEEVIVLSRQKKINKFNEKLTLSSTERVKFVEVPNYKSLRNIFKIFQAKRIIKREIKNSDSLIARLPSSIGSLAVSSAKSNDKPYLLEVVACPWDAHWNHSIKGKIIAPYIYLVTKKLISNSNYSVYVTNNFLQNRYPTKGKFVNCSNVALKELKETTLVDRLKKIDRYTKENKIVIGTTAAIDVRYKGQQYIIKALGKLKKQGNTRFEYQLVGGGNKDFLKSLAKKYDVLEQVHFLGTKPHNEVFNWLDTIDIYVQPSRQEGLPRGLIESLSRGLPAFGAKTGGIPELLEDKYIFSNTSNNISEICHILSLYNKEEMRSQAIRNFHESRLYQKEIIEERRKEFFENFINLR